MGRCSHKHVLCAQIFGFLFLVGILTTVITVEVSIVCTYVQLCAEDYLWWCASPATPPLLHIASAKKQLPMHMHSLICSSTFGVAIRLRLSAVA
jgi:Endomembrane protein 70